MTEKKLPKRVESIISRCRSGETLCRSYRPRTIGESDDVVMWWFEPSGKPCGPASARQAVDTRQIVPCDPGLLNDGNAQSFRAA